MLIVCFFVCVFSAGRRFELRRALVSVSRGLDLGDHIPTLLAVPPTPRLSRPRVLLRRPSGRLGALPSAARLLALAGLVSTPGE